jgi:hypothetical protein
MTSHDVGPSQSAVRLSLRAVVFGVIGSETAKSSLTRSTNSGRRASPCTFHAAAKAVSASVTPVVSAP